jgi:hypothetical protein
MLYDLAPAPPEPGSLLESVFMLITTRRREAEIFKAEALVTAVLGAGGDNVEPIEKALMSLKSSLFPFLEAEKERRAELAKKALKQWTDHKALKVRPLWQMGDRGGMRLQSQLRRSAERTRRAQELRSRKRHMRI